MKTTVVIGASPNENRYSNKAVKSLIKYGYEVIPLGKRDGNIGNKPIITEFKHYNEVDTVTLYIGPQNQPEYYDYILSLQPKRIIFNPGTENIEFQNMAKKSGIQVVEGCTLVMLSVGNY